LLDGPELLKMFGDEVKMGQVAGREDEAKRQTSREGFWEMSEPGGLQTSPGAAARLIVQDEASTQEESCGQARERIPEYLCYSLGACMGTSAWFAAMSSANVIVISSYRYNTGLWPSPM